MKNRYKVYGDLTLIELKYGDGIVWAQIDTIDLPRVAAIPGRWYARKAINGIYVQTKVGKKMILLHRLIMGAVNIPGFIVVDHINGEPLCNRRSNLRLATQAQNMQNRKSASSHSKTKIRGVCWHKKSGKWQVRVYINGKQTWVGAYDNLHDAEQAAIDARRTHYPYSKENLAVLV